VTAAISLLPFRTRYASASLSQERVESEAHERTTVQATIRLPADAAAQAQPLYAERFEARARAVGIPHSTVTILRSADPIPLTVTVPPPDSALAFPLLPPPSELPDSMVRFDSSLARTWATIAPPSKLTAQARARGISNSAASGNDQRFLKALVSSAYLYDLTGKKSYFDTASTLLGALPGIWATFYKKWARRDTRLISAGIIVRRGARSHFTLRVGWRLMGPSAPPTSTATIMTREGGA